LYEINQFLRVYIGYLVGYARRLTACTLMVISYLDWFNHVIILVVRFRGWSARRAWRASETSGL